MRVVLDVCVPRPLAKSLIGFNVKTAARLKLNRLDDGPLLDALGEHCDVFITVDASMRWQQRLEGRPFAVVIMRATSNRLEALEPLIPEVLRMLAVLHPGQVVEVGSAS